MQIEKNKSLKNYNTFGIESKAKLFVSISSVDELKATLADPLFKNPFLLGGGSNMLLTKDIEKPVIYINTKGISVLKKTKSHVFLEVQAGENWHEFVLYCIKNNYGGIENLSLIPGNVGTAPIQNIGAYGVELKDVFVNCKTIHFKTLEQHTFTKEDCNFGYRNSIFKTQEKGNYIITNVVFKLTKYNHNYSTSYGAIKDELKDKEVSIASISNAVIKIRQSKLPDPKKIGNSGSFFKNPVIPLEDFKKFNKEHPEAPYYEVSPTTYKIPAGWLIEQCGFKGKRFGDAGVHKKQALVLVNYGNATGNEIWNLALKIQQEVKAKFNIYIEPEVNII